jgi:hypothetical protein
MKGNMTEGFVVFYLAHGRDQWLDVSNNVMDFGGYKRRRIS